jgi:chemotaxis protein CheD
MRFRKGPEGTATTRYFDKHFQRPAVKLNPGEYHVSGDREVLVTVLGSCVSACIRDPVAGISGMNHFLLPSTNREDEVVLARYGVHAMEVLINGILSRGGQRERLEVKLFGGANLMRSRNTANVGHNNARFASAFMSREGLSVVTSDLFGHDPRKIWYFPESGRVMLRRLRVTRNDTIIRREVAYSRALVEPSDTGGDVELFG